MASVGLTFSRSDGQFRRDGPMPDGDGGGGARLDRAHRVGRDLLAGTAPAVPTFSQRYAAYAPPITSDPDPTPHRFSSCFAGTKKSAALQDKAICGAAMAYPRVTRSILVLSLAVASLIVARDSALCGCCCCGTVVVGTHSQPWRVGVLSHNLPSPAGAAGTARKGHFRVRGFGGVFISPY